MDPLGCPLRQTEPAQIDPDDAPQLRADAVIGYDLQALWVTPHAGLCRRQKRRLE
jgi:hypothetical protein